MVSLEFFIALILPAALTLRVEAQPLTEVSIRGGGWCVWLTTLPPNILHVPIDLKSGSLIFLEP